MVCHVKFLSGSESAFVFLPSLSVQNHSLVMTVHLSVVKLSGRSLRLHVNLKSLVSLVVSLSKYEGVWNIETLFIPWHDFIWTEYFIMLWKNKCRKLFIKSVMSDLLVVLVKMSMAIFIALECLANIAGGNWTMSRDLNIISYFSAPNLDPFHTYPAETGMEKCLNNNQVVAKLHCFHYNQARYTGNVQCDTNSVYLCCLVVKLCESFTLIFDC